MDEIFCPKCGNKISVEENFCNRCGTSHPKINTNQQSEVSIDASMQPIQSNRGVDTKPTAQSNTLNKADSTQIDTKKTPAGVIAFFIVAIVLFTAAIGFGIWRFWLSNPVPSFKNTSAWVPSLASSPTVAPTPTPTPAQSEADMLTVFGEATVDSEGIVKRWEQPINVEIIGNYSQQEYDMIVSQLDMLAGMIPPISIVETGGNFKIYFVPEAEMSSIISYYTPGDTMCYQYNWLLNDRQLSNYAAAVSTDVADQAKRNYLVMRAISRGLGFLGNTEYTGNSILQSDSSLQAFSDNDYIFISMLYSPSVKCGMTVAQAKAALVN